MVPEAGLEPAHSKEYWILSPARLPIPPLRHQSRNSYPGGPDQSIVGEILIRECPKVKAHLSREKCLTQMVLLLYLALTNSGGAIAQLGERMTGSHEVRSSILLGSTNKIKGLTYKVSPFFV